MTSCGIFPSGDFLCWFCQKGYYCRRCDYNKSIYQSIDGYIVLSVFFNFMRMFHYYYLYMHLNFTSVTKSCVWCSYTDDVSGEPGGKATAVVRQGRRGVEAQGSRPSGRAGEIAARVPRKCRRGLQTARPDRRDARDDRVRTPREQEPHRSDTFHSSSHPVTEIVTTLFYRNCVPVTCASSFQSHGLTLSVYSISLVQQASSFQWRSQEFDRGYTF